MSAGKYPTTAECEGMADGDLYEARGAMNATLLYAKRGDVLDRAHGALRRIEAEMLRRGLK